MRYCCAPNCQNTTQNTGGAITFHEIPLHNKDKWVEALETAFGSRTPFNDMNVHICSAHFAEDDFTQGLKIRRLKRTSLPKFDRTTAIDSDDPDDPAYPATARTKVKRKQGPASTLPAPNNSLTKRDCSSQDTRHFNTPLILTGGSDEMTSPPHEIEFVGIKEERLSPTSFETIDDTGQISAGDGYFKVKEEPDEEMPFGFAFESCCTSLVAEKAESPAFAAADPLAAEPKAAAKVDQVDQPPADLPAYDTRPIANESSTKPTAGVRCSFEPIILGKQRGRPGCESDRNACASELRDRAAEAYRATRRRGAFRVAVHCRGCFRKFTSEADLASHVARSCTSPVIEGALERYLTAVREKRALSCVVCGQELGHVRSLRSHLIGHGRGNAFRCDHCWAVFATKASLEKHISVHGEKEPFLCRVCGQVFGLARSLKEHIVSNHSVEKLFHCARCQFSYTTKQSLEKHNVAFHGEKQT